MTEVVISPRALERLKDGPVQGYAVRAVPRGKRHERVEVGLVHWTRAARRPVVRGGPEQWAPGFAPGTVTQVPQHIVEAVQASAPAEIRRTAREKFGELVRDLLADAHAFSNDGRIVWPKSVRDQMEVIGIAQGKADIIAEVEALARHYTEKGAWLQREKDRRHVTAGWHGHTSS